MRGLSKLILALLGFFLLLQVKIANSNGNPTTTTTTTTTSTSTTTTSTSTTSTSTSTSTTSTSTSTSTSTTSTSTSTSTSTTSTSTSTSTTSTSTSTSTTSTSTSTSTTSTSTSTSTTSTSTSTSTSTTSTSTSTSTSTTSTSTSTSTTSTSTSTSTTSTSTTSTSTSTSTSTTSTSTSTSTTSTSTSTSMTSTTSTSTGEICRTTDGTPCTFPFSYLNAEYNNCTAIDNNGVLWCATSLYSSGEALNFGTCSGSCTFVCRTTAGQNCVFPFIYNNIQYNGCTATDNNGVLWCATTLYSSGEAMSFGSCSASCPTAPALTTTAGQCTTTDGAPCIFPFLYNFVSYSTCPTVDNNNVPWCATSIYSSGEANLFGTCSSTCPQ